MCLVLIALRLHADYPLIVAANRDEFYNRPTAAAGFWPDAPSVLAGRDLKAGGTWLGITTRGRLAAVTNYRQGQREPTAPRSRGYLVSEFLTGDAATPEYLQQVQQDAELYNGFNLIAGDAATLFYYSNREGRIRDLPPGVYGLSNHLLDTPWPKVTTTKRAFGELLSGGSAELIDQLFAVLADRRQAGTEQLPSTGVGEEWERLLSSAFIASPDYGTRSSTVVLMARDGSGTFVERRFGREGEPHGEVKFANTRSN